MKSKKLLINVSRLLVVMMLLSLFTFTPVPAAAAEGELNDLITQAEALKAGNEEFPLQISHTDNGSDVNKAFPWVYANELQDLDNALEFARNALTPTSEAVASLKDAIANFTGKIKADGSDPYFRLDPGPGKMPINITAPTNVWTARTPLDNRVPADFAGGTFKMIPYPFADSEGKADVLQINYAHNGKSTFGGISIQSPLSPAVNVPAGSNIEFDVYYPKSAQGKYMRWRVRNTNTNLDSYLRDYQYNNLNPDWVGSYNGETWFKAHHSIVASTGDSSNFILELHGENSRPAETGMLLVANIKITAPDPNGIALPNVVNKENESTLAPLKSIYNREDGLFMVGAIGTGAVTGTRADHYEIFVDGNNLKADGTHPRGPSWLKSVDGAALSGAATTPGLDEYSFPTSSYQAIRDSGTPGQYKSHGHVLAWYNQAPAWMTQIIPANLPSGYNGTTNFYGLGNGVTTTVKVDKEMARRVQFNHTMYVMRHFLTTATKYGSSVSRGVIPFNSWDVLNEEVHESRHSENIPKDADSWKTSLKHTNWLVAMSDDSIGGSINDHYIYLLFKYAHIAAPNAQMAAAYKANYADLPEYMKLDGHDTDGSIDSYIVDNPPKLTYNDYGLATRSKARTVYNMVRELNTAWLSDPLYDGRPLIEDIGIQGHDSIGKTLASDNQYAMALYASLVDQGLLSGISYSELDLKMPTDAPGGGATAPAVLNVRQSDALGYEYALMYKLFTKFAPYIDHIISWGVSGSGWQGSYVLFDSQNNANAGYYGAVNPDRFVLGHSYLDDYFNTEYEKLQDDYKIDLGDLGTYTPSSANADLSGLTLSAGTLEPVFKAVYTQYKVALKDVDSIKVTPLAKDSKATIKVNGVAVESGTASKAIVTPDGETLITIEVTAENKTTVKVYTIKVTKEASAGDTTAPVWAEGSRLMATNISATGLTLTWPAAQDNNGVAGYKIYRGSDVLATVAGNVYSYDAGGLTPDTAYTFKVEAGDAAGNWSTSGPSVQIQTMKETTPPTGDTTAPAWSEGSGLIGTNISTTGLTLTWTAAQDNTGVTGYKIYRGSDVLATVAGNVYSYNASGLTPNTSYTFSVKAGDAAGNWTASGLSTTVKTAKRSSHGGGSSSGGSTTPAPTPTPTPTPVTTPTSKPIPTPTPTPVSTPTPGSSHFKDVGSSFNWAAEAIDTLQAKGIIKGTSETTFDPDKNITRADFVVLLIKALDLKADVDSNFADVSKDAYYYEALGIAKKLGISTGVDGVNFNPNGEISRQDMMVLTAKALKTVNKLSVQGTVEDLNSFNDASNVAPYAADAVAALFKEGIIKGSGNSINPTGTATRAETAVIIFRIYSK